MIETMSARWWFALFAIALMVTAFPVILTPMPPLLDYPNHFVRLWLLEGGATMPPLSEMFRIDWHGASTNIFIDLVAAALAGIVPAAIVGPGVLILGLLLPPIGIAALARQVHGRLTWWHILSVVLGWGQIFLLGFVNFQIALGLALLGAAVEPALERRGVVRATILRFAIGIVLLVAHPFGLLFYALLIAGSAIGPGGIGLTSTRSILNAMDRAIRPCLPLLLLVCLFWLLASHPGDHQGGPPQAIRWQSRFIVGNPIILLSPFKSYRQHADLLAVALFLVPAAYAAARRRLELHWGLLMIAALLVVGSLVMPVEYLGTAYINIRLPVMLWFTLAVAVLPDFDTSRRGRRVAFAFAMLAVTVRAEHFGAIWLRRQPDLAAVRRAFAQIPAGATILPLVQMPDHGHIDDLPLGRAIGSQADFWHMPTLAIAERHAFVPTLFANPGKQVVLVKSPYDWIAVPEGAIASVDKLGSRLDADDRHEFPYLDRWRCFDFVLVLNADVPNAAGPLPMLPGMVSVADEGFARLYRITDGGLARCIRP